MKHLTYAELGEKIAKKIGKFETDLKSTEPDVRNTAKRNMPKLKQAMESLKQSNEQEKVIAEATETRNMMAKGGYMNQFHNGGKTGHTHKDAEFTYNEPDPNTHPAYRTKKQTDLELLEEYREARSAQAKAGDPAWSGGFFGDADKDLSKDKDFQQKLAWSKKVRKKMSPKLQKYYDDNVKLDKGHVLEIYGNPSTPFQTYNPDPFNGEILKARGGYMNRYAGGGYLPMGGDGLDIGEVDMSGGFMDGGFDSSAASGDYGVGDDMSIGMNTSDFEGGGMDWMGLLKNGMGALNSFGGTKGLFGDDEVPTEKYTPEYNKAEEQALANLSQLEQQTNAAYALSQQDTSLDTKGQRMANEKARQRAQKTANVGGPEGFAMQNAANNEARDRAMMIAEKKANQEAMLNSGQAKAAAGSQFTDKLRSLAKERMAIGKSRQDQDSYAQDAYRKDAAGARNINRQTGADESEFAQMQSLMDNQQGVDAGTMQSLMAIFGDPAVQGMLGDLG